jgi:hypothetical protein
MRNAADCEADQGNQETSIGADHLSLLVAQAIAGVQALLPSNSRLSSAQ